MTTDPKTPQAWGNFLAKLWGPQFPVEADRVALDYTARRFSDCPIGKIGTHDVDGFEGMLIERPEKKCWYILLDKRVSLPGRTNFTIAHELGHFLMHRAQENDFRCNQRAVLDYGSGESKKREQEANIFASYLLMPMNDFREQVGANPISFDLLEHCADRYRTSLTATILKWLEFTGEAGVLIVAREGFVLWSKPSTNARKHGFYFPSGTAIPERSRAAVASTFRHEDRAGVLVPRGVWHPSEPVCEMLIVSDRYDFTISLIVASGLNLRADHDEPEPDDAVDHIMQAFEREN